MYHLDLDQQKILLNVLKDFFGDIDVFRAFLRDNLQQNLDDIVTGNLEVARSAVVDRAERYEWLLDLIKALHAEVGPELRARLDEIGTIEEIAEAHFYDDCYPNGEPLVNRKGLRAKLRAATEAAAKRILLVKGNRYTGKSHALRHIRYVAAKLGIPLAEFPLRDYAFGDGIRPSQFGPAIADSLARQLPSHLDVDGTSARNPPSEARWSLNFLNWLPHQIDPNRGRLWIVFDDFEKEKLNVAVPDEVYDFIRLLADRVANNLSGVRLFLINYDRILSDDVGFHLDSETVPTIAEEEIVDFFLDFYRDYLPPTSIEEAAGDSAQRARTVVEQIAAAGDKRLEMMRQTLRSECEKLKAGNR